MRLLLQDSLCNLFDVLINTHHWLSDKFFSSYRILYLLSFETAWNFFDVLKHINGEELLSISKTHISACLLLVTISCFVFSTPVRAFAISPLGLRGSVRRDIRPKPDLWVCGPLGFLDVVAL